MKQVIQLDENKYFTGFTDADESPLEPGVFHLPAGALDFEAPVIPEGKRAKWEGQWVYEDIPEPETQPTIQPYEPTYAEKRAIEYPPVTDYLDGVVKGDQAQIDAYIAACQAVKAKYPKPESV